MRLDNMNNNIIQETNGRHLIVALDISGKSGVATLSCDASKLLHSRATGTKLDPSDLKLEHYQALVLADPSKKPVETKTKRGKVKVKVPETKVKGYEDLGHPWDRSQAALAMSKMLVSYVLEHKPHAIAIEETNPGRNRLSQKFLEWIHLYTLMALEKEGYKDQVFFVNSGDWRSNLGLKQTKEDRKQNAARKKALNKEAETGVKVADKPKGKITPKHIAVRFVNTVYEKDFILKDNDICDAICIGMAYLRNVEIFRGQE